MVGKMASKSEEAQGQSKKGGVKGKFQGIGTYLYNKNEKTVLERSCVSWAKIGVFYLIFYICLAAFWAAMLYAFFTTIEDDQPKLQDWNSLIKYNPGMGYRPQPQVEYTLIKFNQGEAETYKEYIKSLNEFLDVYEDQDGLIDCDPNDPSQDIRDPKLACKFSLDRLGPKCTESLYYGYEDGQPCVLLKMNKLFNWKPEAFSNSSVPDQVANYQPDYVGVTCEGVTDADRDNLGQVNFWPEGGFDMKYFPYQNQDNYLAPLVMVQFERLRPGTLVQVWCKVWAENIYHDRNDRAGSVNFEIMVN